ncbi:MAG: HAMP domain-containing sensor histidine kinase [Luteimonas sp.]
MLHAFLKLHHDELIERCRAKVGLRGLGQLASPQAHFGVPVFLDELIRTLEVEQSSHPMRSREISGPSDGRSGAVSEVDVSARQHGIELLLKGFSIEQVVHDYGDLCQAITDMAFELKSPIETDEFRTLNRCLDNAIAGAVTEFNRQRDVIAADVHAASLNQQLGFFGHEVRNHLTTAMLAVSLIRSGSVGISGATGNVLDRSLLELKRLVDRSLASVRLGAGEPSHSNLISVREFISDTKISATLEADARGCAFFVADVDPLLCVTADLDLLASALGNLLQNAFKFTHPHSEVTLSAIAVGDRVLIEVEDNCGGLPPGVALTMFKPFVQSSEDRTGLGLGLSIARKAVEENGGTLSVRDVSGKGCVFTIDLPRAVYPRTSHDGADGAQRAVVDSAQ